LVFGYTVPAGSGLGGLVTIGVIVILCVYLFIRGLVRKSPPNNAPPAMPGALSEADLTEIAESEGPVDLPDGSQT
jgi:hypothetical protein